MAISLSPAWLQGPWGCLKRKPRLVWWARSLKPRADLAFPAVLRREWIWTAFTGIQAKHRDPTWRPAVFRGVAPHLTATRDQTLFRKVSFGVPGVRKCYFHVTAQDDISISTYNLWSIMETSDLRFAVIF